MILNIPRLLRFFVLAAVLVVAGAAHAWDSRDEAAADEYRRLERERAERYRSRVEHGDVTTGRTPVEAPKRQARRPTEDRRSAESAWDREARAWRERAWRWSEEVGDDLADAIRDAIEDALGEGGGG
ncbi:MAG: hypothetical protein JRH01_02575 [Deltaproteobacteria bacterium]|nr:hypothetical protein [Deltaproteobacteria bacterium]MBW2393853.1 hypothetical protein [Deltaproteobacteria bacterium]